MTKHKDKVSWLVLALIAALTLASILNIIQKSASYHGGFSANLIGVGFGLSLAVTVYIVMIADTAKTRWTAATSRHGRTPKRSPTGRHVERQTDRQNAGSGESGGGRWVRH